MTDSVTFPVGFKFYMPDSVLAAWKKTDAKLLKQGIPKKKRPVSPNPDPEYLTKHSLALELLKEFKQAHPEISIKYVLADALYGTGDFLNEARQFDEEGSSRSLILSLLFDHCLLLHPEQAARIENKLPAFTVGSLRRRFQMEALLEFVQFLLQEDNAGEKLEKLGKQVRDLFQLIPSCKHMSGRDLGRLEATPSLSYKGCVC